EAVGVLQKAKTADERRLERLEAELDSVRRDREAVLASWSWFVRQRLAPIEQLVDQVTEEDEEGLAAARWGDDVVDGWGMVAVVLAAFPLLWSLWAGLCRGGLVLRLACIRLVGGDGRPAARWRCAWRTLVLWLPVVLLLLLSAWLDMWRIASARH